MKTVSIIIPFFNATPFISDCFRQISEQTYDHASIECIFVNDGSTDNSETIIRGLIDKNCNSIYFRVISHESNLGVSAARNTGIDAARNMYLFFMDIDDTITNDCIQTLIDATNQYPSADVLCGNIITKKTNMLHHNSDKAFSSKDKTQNLHDTLLFIYASYSYNKLILRKLIKDYHIYFPVGLPYFEDLHWNIDLVLHCQELVYLPQVTYIYENISTSAMGMSSKRQHLIARCYMSLIDKCLSLDKSTCIIEKHLFLFHYTFQLLNMPNGTYSPKDKIKKVRKELLKNAIKLKKTLLFLYDLQLYQPFRYLSNSKFIKNRSAKLRLWVCKNATS